MSVLSKLYPLMDKSIRNSKCPTFRVSDSQNCSGVIGWNEIDLERMQRCENAVWRCVLGAPSYAPVVTLQGEVGSSCMRARDMKAKLSYEWHVRNGENELVRRIYDDLSEWNKSKWIKKVREYREKIGLSVDELDGMSKECIKRKVDEWETERWNEKKQHRTV